MKARPTIYKGVAMRSRLEASFAARLDQLADVMRTKYSSRLTWEYEPVCFASADGQYLPDFRVVWHGVAEISDPTVEYIEVKAARSGLDLEVVRRKMEIIHASEPEAVLTIRLSNGETWTAEPPNPAWRLLSEADGRAS